jgi:hypothetical protein
LVGYYLRVRDGLCLEAKFGVDNWSTEECPHARPRRFKVFLKKDSSKEKKIAPAKGKSKGEKR